MKIKSVSVADPGMEETAAHALFSRIEKFAGYAFNKSHSCEYSVISYWSMYLKTYYAAEFFAASLDMADEDRRPSLVSAIEAEGILVMPPHINESTDRFEIAWDTGRAKPTIVMPFSAVKGVSDKGSQAIMKARDKSGGKFESITDLIENVSLRACNSLVQDRLRRVGAFATIEAGSIDARHPDRLRDQIELLPGLINQVVKADRQVVVDKFVKAKIIHLINETRVCDKCPLAGGVHPLPRLGSKPKFMVVSDCPNWSEDQAGKLIEGKASNFLVTALKNAGLKVSDGYFTTLVKSIKGEDGITNAMINACSGYLDREIELLKPPVIIALGSKSIRHLVPEAKGGWEALCGQAVYDTRRDATIIFGLNPGMISFEPDRQNLLDEVFVKAAEAV